MKISPMSGGGATVGAVPMENSASSPIAEQLRSIKMKVNRTPDFIEEEPEPIAAAAPSPVAQPAAEMPIPATSVDETQQAPEAVQPLSPQYAALARDKRALQVKEREFAEKVRVFEEQKSTQSSAIPLEQLTSNPIGTLLGAGLTWEQLTDAVVGYQKGGSPDVAALQKRIADMEQGFDKKLSERDTAQEKQALDAMEREAMTLVSKGDEFELIRETRSVPEVKRFIHETYKKTGEVLDVREACQLIEEELTKDALKLTTLKKLQAKMTPQAPVAPARPQMPVRQMRTLTNRDTASVPLDRKARALAAWKGQLQR